MERGKVQLERKTEVPHPDPALAKQGFMIEKYYWNPTEHLVG